MTPYLVLISTSTVLTIVMHDTVVEGARSIPSTVLRMANVANWLVQLNPICNIIT